ncbi:MAG: hypothetical protein COA43_00660 [Robiginitomaculum sp.]|nr:MAG: hypothetical protein COA43_00660 [Robiginitomaculum sp.]
MSETNPKPNIQSIQKNNFFKYGGALAVVGIVGVFAFADMEASAPPSTQLVQDSVPGTTFTSINCNIPVKGMCEAVAGQTVVYITQDGTHAFVGHMLDLKNNRDLTEDRMSSLSSFSKALSGISGTQPASNPELGAATAPRQQPSQPANNIDVTQLSEANAVVHNPEAKGGTVIVFSDPNCGACTNFYQSMASVKDVKFVEYLMPFLNGSVDKAKQILCSENPADALHKGFTNQLTPTPASCGHADTIISTNLAFAEANGITSTPTIFSASGKRLVGARSVAVIRELGKS